MAAQKILIVILGSTASGKTELSLKLAKKFKGEIVSADSRQIYKEMDIGTNKIKNLNGIRHYLIDIVRPDQNFTLSQYKKLAVKTIKNIQKKGKIPFLVGGTGLYIQAVTDNLKIPEIKPNKKLRQKLEKLTEEDLFQKLKKIDPPALKFIDSHNKRRLIRALEICLSAKKPFSQQREKGKPLFNVLEIGLKINKKKLKEKIKQRTQKMIKSGLIKETKKLLEKYSVDLPSMSGIGYQEISRYINGEINLDQAEKIINQRTWRYSRRQITWFKKDKRIKWVKKNKEAEKIIGKFLKN